MFKVKNKNTNRETLAETTQKLAETTQKLARTTWNHSSNWNFLQPAILHFFTKTKLIHGSVCLKAHL